MAHPVLSRAPVANEAELIERHRGTVATVAGRFWRRYGDRFSFDELEAAALEGALLAIRAYDPGKRVKLLTYAWRRARTAVVDYMRKVTPGTRANPVRELSLDAHAEDLGETVGDLKAFAAEQDLDAGLRYLELLELFPPTIREDVDLRFRLGWTWEAIGARRGSSAVAALARVRRALRQAEQLLLTAERARAAT